MKKFLYPLPLFAALLCAFLLNCSSDGFEKPQGLKSPNGLDVGGTETSVKCLVVKGEGENKSKYCYEISKSACEIIGGNDITNTDEKCISFTCEWNSNSVDYGQYSTLSFKWGNTGQEDCSYEISDKNKTLEIGDHQISKTTFSNLPYYKDTSIVATATVTCGEEPPITQPCKPLAVKSIPIKFTCGWSPEKIQYGGKTTVNFAFDQISENIAKEECTSTKISPLGVGEHTISSSTIPGLSYSKDTSIVATATVTCRGQNPIVQNCGTLKVDSVPGPKWTGTFSFKKLDFKANDTNYFFIGTRVDTSYIENTLRITNKDVAECGDVKIKIDDKVNGNTTAKQGTPIKATAIVYCKYTDTLELASINAVVLPNYTIGNCELSGGSKTTMRQDETLTIGISVDNNFGRCTKIEYTFNGSTYSSSSSFALTNSVGTTLSNIKARVTCTGSNPTEKTCPSVSVARYQELKTECREANRDKRDKITFKSGKTIIDFVCDTDKKDYYISCDTPQRTNFSVEIDGYKEGDSENDIRPNGGDSGYNFPGLQTIPEGSLFRYPISVTINNKISGDLKCGIW
jgi:hypothetical protein